MCFYIASFEFNFTYLYDGTCNVFKINHKCNNIFLTLFVLFNIYIFRYLKKIDI